MCTTLCPSSSLHGTSAKNPLGNYRIEQSTSGQDIGNIVHLITMESMSLGKVMTFGRYQFNCSVCTPEPDPKILTRAHSPAIWGVESKRTESGTFAALQEAFVPKLFHAVTAIFSGLWVAQRESSISPHPTEQKRQQTDEFHLDNTKSVTRGQGMIRALHLKLINISILMIHSIVFFLFPYYLLVYKWHFAIIYSFLSCTS